MRFNKLFLPISLLAIGVLWGACVDVPDGPSTTIPDFRSLARFFHAAPAAGAGNVSVDGTSAGNIVYLASTSYGDVASGTRSVAFGATAAQTISFGSEQQSTVVIYPSGAGVAYINLVEGDMDKNNGKVGVAKVKFVNAATGSATNVTFHSGAQNVAAFASAALGVATPYTEVPPGSVTVYAHSGGTYPATINGAQETPAVTTISSGTGTVTMSDTGGVRYTLDVKADNSQGFYIAAHFHNEAAGTAGPVKKAIDVTKQQMSFRADTLKGSNEVPPVATAATGIGTFTMWRDSLRFSLNVKADTLDTTFTSASFHNAASGAVGLPVRTITIGTFGDTVITGTWKTTDSEPLTPALVSEIISGNVYVNFNTVLNPTGAIRAQLRVDTTTTSTYSGVWKDSTLTPALRTEFNLNRMYVNFHSVANPGGQVRGQATPTNMYATYSLPAATYEDGKMYTIVATGAGSTLQLSTLQDRQVVARAPIGKPQIKTVSTVKK